jgi:hypothetical protein
MKSTSMASTRMSAGRSGRANDNPAMLRTRDSAT